MVLEVYMWPTFSLALTCDASVQCAVQHSFAILSLWITWISQGARLHVPHLTIGATQIFVTTLSVSVGVFDLVNHRKALPVNLPLDLKDVCGFPLSHQSPQRRWGWMEVILVCVVFFLYIYSELFCVISRLHRDILRATIVQNSFILSV